MKKLLFTFSLFLFLMICFGSTANADTGDLKMIVNDEWLESAALDSFIKEGTTYVPLRFFSNSLDAYVEWDAKTRNVTITKNGSTILINTDEGVLTDSNKHVQIQLSWKDNHIYAPAKQIAEELGYGVSYLAPIHAVRFTTRIATLTDEDFIHSIAKNSPRVQTSSLTYEHIAFLTFDDGPTASTSSILDILKENDVKATFFMLYGNITNNQSIVKRMKEEGHSLGSHGVTHQKDKFYRSTQSVLEEMNTTSEEIKQITSTESFLIRVPYGSHPYMKPEYRAAVEQEGYLMWDWNVDSEDWRYPDNPDKIINLTIKQIDALGKQGKNPVILFHDKKQTVKVLPTILTYLKQKGYSLRAITPNDVPVQFKS